MLLKIGDHLQSTKPFSKPYRGFVVSNNDPKKLNRIKVNIPEFLEGDVDKLPFIFSDNPTGLGGRPDLSGSFVPEVGSEVKVEFPFGSQYAGFYTGYWQSSGTHQGSTFNEDYPESYGFRDGQGTHLKINKTKKFLELQHTSGAKFFIDSESLIQLVSRKAIEFLSEDGKTSIKFDMVTGEMSLNPKDILNLTANTVNMTPPIYNLLTSTKNEEIAGGSTTEILGGRKLGIGGSDSQSVIGNRAISIASKKSELIGDTTETTYGKTMKETVVLGDMLSTLIKGDKNVTLLLGNHKTMLTAGNYDVDIIAGNITIKTAAGSFKLDNSTVTIEADVAGGLKIDATLTMDLTAGIKLTAKAPIIELNSGLAPVLTEFTDPFVDLITGVPTFGVQTILAGD